MGMSNATMTIDASIIQSRILQSASLAKEDTTMDDTITDEQPTFPQLSALAASRGGKTEYRRVRCPPHRYTPLRENWEQILTPLVEFLKLQASFHTLILLFSRTCRGRKLVNERTHGVVPRVERQTHWEASLLSRRNGATFVAV